MKFTKMQGLGNDYLYIYGEVPENVSELSKKLSDVHFGVGSDGLIYISKSEVADFKMRIFNADGSEAKMCGNGIRCVGKYLYDKGYTDKKQMRIETLSGIKNLTLRVLKNRVKTVSVDMGKAEVGDPITLVIDHKAISLIPVSVGNPHAVIFVDDVQSVPLEALGSRISRHEAFPDGVNVEFVEVLAENQLRMRVWERGSGVTKACGTGACASVMAAIFKNKSPLNQRIWVKLDGGTLEIEVQTDHSVRMTGPAETIFEGEIKQC